MENCEYSRILTNTGLDINVCEKSTWKPLLRQCMVTCGVCGIYFMQGLFMGAPTVLVAQIRRDVNSTEVITDEMLSWLTTTPMLSAVPFVILLPLLFNRIGRKLTFLLVWLIAIIGFIVFYNSPDLHYILISEVCAGVLPASGVTISPVIIAEYTSPKYRGIFLCLKGATVFWGIWISNAIGTFFHWKNITIAFFVCSANFISVLLWPESPYWLAKRGRYAESIKSHRWMKGANFNSEKELAQLLLSQKKINDTYLPTTDSGSSFCCSGLYRAWSIITSRPFYKPAVICIVLLAQFNFTGKFVISMYAIEVLRHITPDQSFAYRAMLILDGVTVFSMYTGCIISRYFKRRTLLLLFSGIGILLLYTLSVYLYLVSVSFIMQNDIGILLLLTVFSIAISCGPMILCTSIYGEIMPLRYQNIAMILIGLGGILIAAILLKLSPFIFKSFKMHGSFLLFAISSTVILAGLYIYLPETKDRTIQDIEKLFAENQMSVEGTKITPHREIELNNLL